MSYRLTWLAIILTFLLSIPGLLVGGAATYLYRLFVLPMLGGNFIDWLTGGWLTIIFMAVFPNLLHGAVGGGIGLWASAKIAKHANYEIVAYSISAIVVLFSGVALFGIGIEIAAVELLANSAGIIIGLFLAWQHVKTTQDEHRDQTAPGAKT